MTSAYILIMAILILGGLIAALGDRIGTKVGKARLRIFNLRPKQTAILFTVVTGTIISASTLGILFALSSSLRQGVFQLDEILKKRRHVKAELEQVTQQKIQVEQNLKKAEIKQEEAKKRLEDTEIKLQFTEKQLKTISNQANELRKEVKKILKERKELLKQQKLLNQQNEELQKQLGLKEQELNLKESEINAQDKVLIEQKNRLETLEKEQALLQTKISFQDEQIEELDQAIAIKDNELIQKENRLINIQKELYFVQQKVEILEDYYHTYQELRERPIALIKGQVLTIAVVKNIENQKINESIDHLLRQANLTAIEALNYGNETFNPNKRIVQITTNQAAKLKKEIAKEGEHFIRIISAGNYVKGEEEVRVFIDISDNKQIYAQGEIIAKVSIDNKNMTEQELQERLDFLISVTQFRARKSGVLGRIIIADGKLISLINFLQQLQESEEEIKEIQAVVSNNTYTSGPLEIRLLVINE